MKTKIAMTFGLALVASVHADMANYEATVAGQNPAYLFNFDNSLTANIGTGTFTGNGTAGFATDLSGNANDALSVGGSPSGSGYTLSSPNIISGGGSTVSSGSLSFLFNVSSALSGTEYLFSGGGDVTSDNNALALAYSSSAFEFKVGNHSFASSTYLPDPTAGTWYYFATTWNFNGANPSSDVVDWYIGAVGGTLIAGNNTLVTGAAFTSATEVGGGGTVVLGNREALNSPTAGDYDELATWDGQLTSSQITDQFDALTTPVPEPSAGFFLGAGALMLALLGLKRP